MTRHPAALSCRDIPLIGPWSAKPFPNESGGAASDPAKMLEGFGLERSSILEAAVGEWNTVPASLLAVLAERRRAVARIVVPAGQVNWTGVAHPTGWTGTGFMVAPNLLVTNHHVLNSATVAGAASIEFDYERPPSTLANPSAFLSPPTVAFTPNPERLFVTSPTGPGLDYTFVWMPDEAAARFGTIQMRRGSLMVSLDEPTFVIHHPQGRLKEASLDDTELLSTNQIALLYAADTDYGSSGACVFNSIGQLVALHHARRSGSDLRAQFPNARTRLRDNCPVTVANEGIKISAIALDLEARAQSDAEDAGHAAEILSEIKGSDSLTSIFGGLGRRVEASADQDRVRGLIDANAQDLDIGFWDLGRLPSLDSNRGRIDAMALAMADINLDVWCLTDVQPQTVFAVTGLLRDRFGQFYDHVFAEPDLQQRNQTTAILWRPETATLARAPWPDEVPKVWAQVMNVGGERRGLDPAPPMPGV